MIKAVLPTLLLGVLPFLAGGAEVFRSDFESGLNQWDNPESAATAALTTVAASGKQALEARFDPYNPTGKKGNNAVRSIRIPVKKNLLVFFGVNLATQLLLTVIMTQALRSSGLITAYLILIPLELAILAVEMTIYAFLLQGVSKRRRMAYAATANVVSAVLGFILTGVCDSFINML